MEATKHFGGKFWEIREDQESDDASDEDISELRSPPTTTLADAFGRAKGHRSKQRKGRKSDLDAIALRLREVVRAKTTTLSAAASPFISTTATRTSAPATAVVNRYAPPPETEQDAVWFQIVRGRAIRVPSRSDPDLPQRGRDVSRSPSASLGSSPVNWTSRSPAGEVRNPGDDIELRVGEMRVSIRSMGRSRPPKHCSHTAQVTRPGEVSSRVVLPRRGEKTFRSDHLSPLLSHLWCPVTDLGGETAGEEEMGDRFGPGRGGNDGGAGGGRGAGNFQFRPPQRPYQGNFPYNQNQNQQYRGQFGNQFRGQNPNSQYYHQSNFGNQRSNSNNSSRQFYNNNQRSGSTDSSSHQSEAANKQVVPSFVPKTNTGSDAAVKQKETAATVDAEGGAAKLQCFRCWNHGNHVTKDCKADVLCVNCDKTSHISTKCAWLHQKKPVASFVGFGGEGLGCFVAEHTKEAATGSKGAATALVRIKDDSEGVSAEKLEFGLGSTYPWRWVWKAKGVAAGAFLVNFPSVARINEAAIYDWVPLKKVQFMVNVKLWTDESLAAGKMTTVWVKAKGVPRTLKNFHGLCEIGSTLGQHIEADMEHLKATGQVRLKVGVVNHLKIPKWTQVTTPKLHYYRIYFQLEEIVEMGWDREEDEIMQDFEDIMDSQPEEKDDRDPKRQKNSDLVVSSPSEQIFPADKNVVASTLTRIALEQREQSLKEQDDEDVRINLQKTGKSLLSTLETVVPKGTQERSGESDMDTGGSEKNGEERVQLSEEDTEEEIDASQTDSFGEKVKAFGLGQNQGQPRCSGRLAAKNPDDVSILEKAKNYKAKTTDKDEGIGGRKTGASNGRKGTGTSR